MANPHSEPDYQRIVGIDALTRAFARIAAKNRHTASGGDRIGVPAFERHAATYLAQLAQDLAFKTYRPGPVRQVHIPKRSGGVRRLSIPCLRDRIVQTSAHLVLAPYLDREMEDASFAYRTGRSVQQAVARVSAYRAEGFTWVVDGDIDDFFDNVPHHLLLQRVARSIRDTDICKLIALWLVPRNNVAQGIAQGSPISPLLASLYLDDVDEAVRGKGVRFVRFADDFLILCKTQERAADALANVATLLKGLGLNLNPQKTRIVRFEDGFKFLGKLFVRSMVIDSAHEDVSESADSAEQSVPPAAHRKVQYGADRAEKGAAYPQRRAETLEDAATDAEDDLLGEEAQEDWSPVLRTLYVFGRGRRVELRNEAFAVMEGNRTLLAIPPSRIDRVDVGPDTDMDVAALRHAAANDVAVHFCDRWGAPIATCAPSGETRSQFLLAQAKHHLNEGTRSVLARQLVVGRIKNQRALLNRLNRKRRNCDIDRAITALTHDLRKLPLKATVAEVMQVEAEAAAVYWPAWAKTLPPPWTFDSRSRRPPLNPVNAVLSFLASMLHRDIDVLVRRHGLHSGIGMLHAANRGSSAASDLIEPFRAPLVEGLCSYLFNNRNFRDEDFETSDDDGSCRIMPVAREKVVRGYERWVGRAVQSQRTGSVAIWRRLLDEEVLAFRNHIAGDVPYEPYVMRY